MRVALLLVLLLAWAATMPSASASPEASTRPDVGALAPEFVLRDERSGQPLRLSSLRGQMVVLTFWAFWCDTWRDVRTGYRRLADERLPARLIAVAVDPTRRELMSQPDEAPPVFFPVLVDETRAVADRYAVDAVPTVIVLDASGRLVFRERGWPRPSRIVRAVSEARR